MATLAAVMFVVGGVVINNRGDVQSTRSTVAAKPTNSTLEVASSQPAAVSESSASTVPAEVKPFVSTPAETQIASLSFVGGTQDLSEAELETLLAELETMEGMPAAEPQNVITTIENIDGGE
jgi:hypothetical protein